MLRDDITPLLFPLAVVFLSSPLRDTPSCCNSSTLRRARTSSRCFTMSEKDGRSLGSIWPEQEEAQGWVQKEAEVAQLFHTHFNCNCGEWIHVGESYGFHGTEEAPRQFDWLFSRLQGPASLNFTQVPVYWPWGNDGTLGKSNHCLLIKVNCDYIQTWLPRGFLSDLQSCSDHLWLTHKIDQTAKRALHGATRTVVHMAWPKWLERKPALFHSASQIVIDA